jgi:hypothetical protein
LFTGGIGNGRGRTPAPVTAWELTPSAWEMFDPDEYGTFSNSGLFGPIGLWNLEAYTKKIKLQAQI